MLAERPNCKTASAIVRQMATTERLRDEQFPQRDYPIVMFALVFAVLCMAGVMLQ